MKPNVKKLFLGVELRRDMSVCGTGGSPAPAAGDRLSATNRGRIRPLADALPIQTRNSLALITGPSFEWVRELPPTLISPLTSTPGKYLYELRALLKIIILEWDGKLK